MYAGVTHELSTFPLRLRDMRRPLSHNPFDFHPSVCSRNMPLPVVNLSIVIHNITLDATEIAEIGPISDRSRGSHRSRGSPLRLGYIGFI